MDSAKELSNVVQFSSVSAHRLPPHNIDVEMALLGGIMLDPEAFILCQPILRPEMFYIPAHEGIYRAMATLFEIGTPPDLMQVANYLTTKGLMDGIGGRSKLASLFESSVTSAVLDGYAQIIRDKWVRRKLIKAGNSISELGYETETDTQVMLDSASHLVHAIAADNPASNFGAKSPEETLIAIFHRLEQGTEPPVLKTGLYDLDAMIGGLRRGDLDIVAGRSGIGKTQLGVYLAYQVAVIHQQPVVFFSAEMSREKLMCRFLALDSEIDSSALLNNKIAPHQWSRFTESIGTLSSCPLRIDEHPNPSVSHMRSEVQRVKSEFGDVGLVVLDYLQMLGSSDTRMNRVTEVDQITKECKAIAKEFDVPFLALAQINRSVEGRNNKRPLISDLRESGGLEQAADLVLLLYREDYYDPNTPDRGLIEVIVGKNRDGSCGTAKFLFDPSLSRFRNFVK